MTDRFNDLAARVVSDCDEAPADIRDAVRVPLIAAALRASYDQGKEEAEREHAAMVGPFARVTDL